MSFRKLVNQIEKIPLRNNKELRELRRNLGLSQDKMAALLETPYNTYCNFEKDRVALRAMHRTQYDGQYLPFW